MPQLHGESQVHWGRLKRAGAPALLPVQPRILPVSDFGAHPGQAPGGRGGAALCNSKLLEEEQTLILYML